MTFKNPIFCAIDTTDVTRAQMLAHALAGSVGGLKLGLEYFNACGHEGYRAVAESGAPIFLDLKLHDIPNTVAGGIRAVLPLKPAIVNVHASGGKAMMQAAAKAASEAGSERPLVIGVTVLTSLDQHDLAATGIASTPRDQVRRLAALAAESGLDGVVCGSHEIEVLRQDLGAGFKLIVPGIRPAGSAINDQKRVMTPQEALALGADILVIGRPITEANDPLAAARGISTSLAA
ncbi:MAG: orotidine-5'-phosphate decarboxylase [Rhizobiales bacterium]|nr:orotidine-5'-phosphate decarboxylase [Hyphomicrobiales bacterium]